MVSRKPTTDELAPPFEEEALTEYEQSVLAALTAGQHERVIELTQDFRRVPREGCVRQRLELARVSALSKAGRGSLAQDTLDEACRNHPEVELRLELEASPALAPAQALLTKREWDRRKSNLGTLAGVFMLVTMVGYCNYRLFIYPHRSEEGQATKQFVLAVGRGDYETAHGHLSQRRAAELAPEALADALPASLRGATDFAYNGNASMGESGAIVRCMSGWPGGGDDDAPEVAFKFVEEGGAQRIDAWARGGCDKLGFGRP